MSLNDTLQSAANFIRKKTDAAVDTGKLALELRRKKAEVENAKKELAEIVCEAYTDGAMLTDEIAEKCADIGLAQQDADTLSKKLTGRCETVKTSVKTTVQSTVQTISDTFAAKKSEFELHCPECGAHIKDNFLYCPLCGAKLESVDDIVDSATAAPTAEDEAAASDEAPKAPDAPQAGYVKPGDPKEE